MNEENDQIVIHDADDLGRVLKRTRKDAMVSQSKLAKDAGVTIRSITHWENGTRKMSLYSAEKVFRALKKKLVIG